MFIVKWVVHGHDGEPVESEEFRTMRCDVTVEASKLRLPTMRLQFSAAPPDGFLVFDSREKELCRWFGPRPT
jgi:hypothetical protein